MGGLIEADLRSWSAEVLEVSNPHLAGMPACPYAKQAWKQDKVLVVESEDFFADGQVYCAKFAELGKDLVVVASYDIPDIEDLQELVEHLHETHPELHCMQFHPDYDAGEAELDFLTDNDWESGTKDAYCMLFIQDLRLVVEASDKLEPLGYYSTYPYDEYESLVLHRKRRLTNGDETTGDEARRQN
jgi:hypothetical protein